MPPIPDTWMYTVVGGSGSFGVITVPAPFSNVRRIVTDIRVKLFCVVAGVGTYFPVFVIVSSGVTLWRDQLLLNLPDVGTTDETGDGGLPVTGAPGTSVVCQLLTATPVGVGVTVTVKGYNA